MSVAIWFELALLVAFGAAYVVAGTYPDRARQFPQLIALVSLLLTALALVQDYLAGGTRPASPQTPLTAGRATEPASPQTPLTAGRATEPASPQTTEPAIATSRVAKAAAIIVVATLAGAAGGFLLSVLLLFLGFAFFFGAREAFWRHAAWSVGVSVVIYLLFDRVMGVPLLAGLLW